MGGHRESENAKGTTLSFMGRTEHLHQNQKNSGNPDGLPTTNFVISKFCYCFSIEKLSVLFSTAKKFCEGHQTWTNLLQKASNWRTITFCTVF